MAPPASVGLWRSEPLDRGSLALCALRAAAPRAVISTVYDGLFTSLSGLDHAGLCIIYANTSESR